MALLNALVAGASAGGAELLDARQSRVEGSGQGRQVHVDGVPERLAGPAERRAV
jgi:hypothetical protein